MGGGLDSHQLCKGLWQDRPGPWLCRFHLARRRSRSNLCRATTYALVYALTVFRLPIPGRYTRRMGLAAPREPRSQE